MSSNALANRYAQALFDAAEDHAQAVAFGAQLEDFLRLLADEPGLAAYIADRSIGAPAKRELVQQGLVDWQPYVKNFLCLVFDKGREHLLPQMAASYRQLLAKSENRSFGQLYTAVPVEDEQVAALSRALSARIGSTLELEQKLDPALLGGAKVRLGDTVIDGTLSAQLKALHTRLIK